MADIWKRMDESVKRFNEAYEKLMGENGMDNFTKEFLDDFIEFCEEHNICYVDCKSKGITFKFDSEKEGSKNISFITAKLSNNEPVIYGICSEDYIKTYVREALKGGGRYA